MKPDIFSLHILYIVSWSQKDLRLSLQDLYYDAVGVYGFPYKVYVMKPEGFTVFLARCPPWSRKLHFSITHTTYHDCGAVTFL